MYWLILLFASIILVYIYFKRSYSYWERRGMAFLPPSIPFGNIKGVVFRQKSFGTQLAEIYNYLKERGEKFGGFYMLTLPSFMPVDPELIKDIILRNFGNFNHRGLHYDEEIDPLSATLFVLGGNKWKNLRSKISPTFTSGKMKGMFSTLLNVGVQLEEAVLEISQMGEPVEMKGMLAKFTTDVIGSCVFGVECNSFKDPHSEFRKYGKMFLDTTANNNLITTINSTMPILMTITRTPFIHKDVTKFFMTMLKETVNYREANKIHRPDFMDMFIKLKNKEFVDDSEMNVDVEELTFNELAAQAFVFFVAGFETSSTAVSLCLYELALNQGIQDKLREELHGSLKKHGGNITYEGLMEMQYLDQVVCETLRKYPSAPMLIRKCTNDYTIPDTNIVVESGTRAWISIMGLHRDPDYYPDPDKFDPERFTEEEKAKRIPYTYLPFGDGPRHCVGMRFALLQTKIGIALLLNHFKFTLDARTKVPVELAKVGVLLSAKDPIWLLPQRIVD